MLLLAGALFAAEASAQVGASGGAAVPTLPARHDTMIVRLDGNVIGRGITQWQRLGLEQLQVYTWLSALDADTVTDSLFVDPSTLRPIRETRVTRDTTFQVHFTRDTLFVSRLFGGRTVTSFTVAPTTELYSSASIEMLAATMPLRNGASRSVLAFFAPPAARGTEWVVLVVRSRTLVSGRAAWRVVANRRADSTAYWVDEATRRILQFDEFEGPTRVVIRPASVP